MVVVKLLAVQAQMVYWCCLSKIGGSTSACGGTACRLRFVVSSISTYVCSVLSEGTYICTRRSCRMAVQALVVYRCCLNEIGSSTSACGGTACRLRCMVSRTSTYVHSVMSEGTYACTSRGCSKVVGSASSGGIPVLPE